MTNQISTYVPPNVLFKRTLRLTLLAVFSAGGVMAVHKIVTGVLNAFKEAKQAAEERARQEVEVKAKLEATQSNLRKEEAFNKASIKNQRDTVAADMAALNGLGLKVKDEKPTMKEIVEKYKAVQMYAETEHKKGKKDGLDLFKLFKIQKKKEIEALEAIKKANNQKPNAPAGLGWFFTRCGISD